MKKISVVLPCYNEGKNLPDLIPLIIKNIPKKYDYEIICVDDASSDETPEIIDALARKNKKIKGIFFYRRFGQTPALLAGILNAKGDAIITMDSDFEHPPELLSKAILAWKDGHDLVLMQKDERWRGRKARVFGRNLGYFVWKWVSDGMLIPGVSEFRLMDRQIVRFLLKFKESEPFIRGLVNLAAKNPFVIPYKVGRRKYGKSGYNLTRDINLFVNGVISFSTKPLRLFALGGLILSIVNFVILVVDATFALILGKKIVPGYLTIVFLVLFLNGFIIFYLGMLGEYIAVIFKEVKRRPKFLIERKVNL